MLTGKERVCVQGITGRYGSTHTIKMLKYGTNIVCGTSKRDLNDFNGIPVLHDEKECVEKYGVDTSIVFVPAPNAKTAVQNAIYAGIKKIVVITEHIPVHDALSFVKLARERNVTLIGPNCPGVIVPGVSKLGIMPEKYFKKGEVAVISKSGTLMYEVASEISKGPGISIALGLGGDPIVGTTVSEAFSMVMNLGIDKVVIVGEVGGNEEVEGVKSALENGFNGKIVAFFAGRYAPEGKTMGHAGAIVEGTKGKITYKEQALKAMGIEVAKFISEIREAF